MTREEFMDIVYSELYSDGDNYRANRIIDAADEYAEDSSSENPNKWIPVNEMLPEPVTVGAIWKRKVLITCYLSFDDEKERFVATEYIDNVISKKDINDRHIIAWMPLPKTFVPQEGVNE